MTAVQVWVYTPHYTESDMGHTAWVQIELLFSLCEVKDE